MSLFPLPPLYAKDPFSSLDHPENTQFEDITGLMHVIRAELLRCEKAHDDPREHSCQKCSLES